MMDGAQVDHCILTHAAAVRGKDWSHRVIAAAAHSGRQDPATSGPTGGGTVVPADWSEAALEEEFEPVQTVGAER